MGFLLVDKPEGPTSHDMVAAARRILGIRRIGHTGTLDPFASGLLILCIGKATRLSEYLLRKDKTYRFEVILGACSDTYDRTGRISRDFGGQDPGDIGKERVLEVLHEFTGEIEQIPPLFSALKVKGKKLYEYARAGESVELKPRRVKVHDLRLIDFTPPRLCLEARVGSGTYIRSLGHDIGKRLGVGALLDSLRRTRIGTLELSRAVSLQTPEKNPREMQRGFLSIREALPDWGCAVVSGEAFQRIVDGNPVLARGIVPLPPDRPEEPFFLLDSNEKVVCVAEFKKTPDQGGEWSIKPVKVLCREMR